MNTIKRKEQSGFTIIEVVLVLAIAGLIFLVVFLALPQLQRSRRDTQRRSDAGRLLAELENFASNSNGNYPGVSTQAPAANNCNSAPSGLQPYSTFQTANLGGLVLQDPGNGTNYTALCGTGAQSNNVPLGNYQYLTNAACTDGGSTIAGSGPRSIAIRMGVESGTAYCSDNQ